MNPKQALERIAHALSQLNVTLQQHQELQAMVGIVVEALDKKPETE